MTRQFAFKPPYGVTFTQTADGTIIFNYTSNTRIILRDCLRNASRELTQEAITDVEKERKEEIERQRLPINKIQTLDSQINTLKSDLDEIPLSVIPSSLAEYHEMLDKF